MKPDEQRIRDVLVDTIRLLCRTGIEYSHRLRVQGLLGITVDDEHVFLIHVDDFITRNCSDVHNRLCGLADKCHTGCVDHINSEDSLGGEGHSVSPKIHANGTQHCLLGAGPQHSNDLSLKQTTQNDVLTAVAVSQISAAVDTTAESQTFSSSQLPVYSMHNITASDSVLPTVLAENCCKELSAAGSHTADSASLVNLSMPDEMAADNETQQPGIIKMEANVNEEQNQTENVVQLPAGDGQLVRAALAQKRCRLSNLDDIDSSSADTNDDGDSVRTSESEELADYVTMVPQIDLISSLPQYNPQALVRNVSGWKVGGVQPNHAEVGAETVSIQPSVLSGVVPAGGSHVSAYYQQQVSFFIKF